MAARRLWALGVAAFLVALLASLTPSYAQFLTPPSGALPGGTVGTFYTQVFDAGEGGGPFGHVYLLQSGTVPTGLTLSPSGVLSGTPSAAGPFSFRVLAITNAAFADYTLTVAPAPLPPPPVAGAVSTTVAANSANNPITLALSGSAATSVAVASAPGNGTATASGTSITYTPTPGQSGADSFTYTATNPGGTSAPATVTITITQPPPIAGAASATVAANSANNPITLALSGGPATSVAVASAPGKGTATASGTSITYTPTAGQSGADSFTYTATNPGGTSAPATVTITISPPPPIAGAVSATVAANSANNPITLALSGGTAASVAVASAQGKGTATASGTSITYTPAAGASGNDTFTYTATNPSGTSAPATVTITITPPPLQPPVAGAASATVAANSANNPITLALSGGAAASVAVASAPAKGTATASGTGITYTPTAGQSGPDTFTYTATNASGTSAPATVTITISPPALQPPVAGATSASVAANSANNPITLALSGGAAASVAVASAPGKGTAAASGTGITYTPTAGASGADTFTYTATNASGTSAPASVTITITAAPVTLSLSPGAGALPSGTIGNAYPAQTFVASGGASPYSYAISAGALPAGLSLSGTGLLSGTPTAAGTANFTVQARDASGATVSAAYSIAVGGNVPIAVPESSFVIVKPGETVSINITRLSTGGPFTAAAIPNPAPPLTGHGQIVGQNGVYAIVFTAVANPIETRFSLRFTLSNQVGTSAPATIIVMVRGRPDPTLSTDVNALMSAQTDATRRFATEQIGNFNQRLEQLHGGGGTTVPGNFLQLSTGAELPPDQRLGYARDLRMNDPAGSQMSMPTKAPPRIPTEAPRDLQAWAGGFVNFGSARTGESDLRHVMAGVSGGIDYRFSPNFAAGIGIGYGRDRTDIGINGSESRGQAFSGAIYSSYHANRFFLDTLLGFSKINFDSRRFTNGPDFAIGKRDGNQIFGSVTAGYDIKINRSVISPYVRIQGAHAKLDAFTETGAGALNLAFGRTPVEMIAGVVGLRAEHLMPMSWGALTARGRVEYTHDFAGSSLTSLGYADLGPTLPFSVEVAQSTRDYLTVSAGLGARFDNGWRLGFDYRTTFGFDGNAQNHSFMTRAGVAF